jgi:sugar phosphate isomerase/epimerase
VTDLEVQSAPASSLVEPAPAPAVRVGCDVYARRAGLADDLAHLVACGYDAAELPVEPLGCVLGARLVERTAALVAEICAEYDGTVVYSMHAPAVLDLRDQRIPALHLDILLSCVRLAAAVKARVLVVHYEARSEDAAVEAQYRRFVETAADLAGRHEVILGIENIEVERSERVLEFLDAVRHPWVRMTYDFGHDYLAGDLFGYDHLASARACAPYAAHLHVTDNFGRFHPARLGDFNLWRAMPYGDLIVTGMGDLHLPIGYGTLPMTAVYAPFAAQCFSGLVVSEHERRAFPETDQEVCGRLRELTAR